MRLDPRTTRPWLLGVKSGLLAGGIGILVALAVLIVVASRSFQLVFGVKYLEAYDLIQVMLGACDLDAGLPSGVIAIDGGKTARFSRGANHRLNRLHRIAVHVLSSVWRAGSSVCLFRRSMSGCGAFANSDLKGIFSAPFRCFITQPERNPDDEKIFPA